MIKLGFVMDPIASINIKKDSSFAMLLEAQRRGYEIHYMEMNDLSCAAAWPLPARACSAWNRMPRAGTSLAANSRSNWPILMSS